IPGGIAATRERKRGGITPPPREGRPPAPRAQPGNATAWPKTFFHPDCNRRPRTLTGICLAARGLGTCLTADREFHPALKVCVVFDCGLPISVYSYRLGLSRLGSRQRGKEQTPRRQDAKTP